MLAAPAKVASDCGLEWRRVQSLDPGSQLDRFSGVDASSDSDVWAVGRYQDASVAHPQMALIEHWNGSSWITATTPPTTDVYQELLDVDIVSANNIWAVGDRTYGRGMPPEALAMHWNGSSWSRDTGVDPGYFSSDLNDVVAVSANDVWVAGYYQAQDNVAPQTFVEHWNGTSWSQVPTPNVGSYSNYLSQLSVIGPNNIWAVGQYAADPQAGPGAPWRTLVLHWNGSSWSVVTSPNLGAYYNALLSVAAVSASDIWAVGLYRDAQDGPAFTLALHWDGAHWALSSPMPGNPNGGGADNSFYSVIAFASNDVVALGDSIQRWNGSQWSVLASGSQVGGTLRGAKALTRTDIWSVGLSSHPYPATPSETTVVLRYSDPCAPVTCAVQFTDVPASSPFYNYIRCLACRNILSGYSDEGHCGAGNAPCFLPNANITRGQAAKIVAGAAGYSDNISANQQSFADVPSSNPFWLYIERVHEHGAISGSPCTGKNGEPAAGTCYRPGDYLTRGQLAKIATNAAGFSETPGGQAFNDVPPSQPFYVYVERAHLHNIISGYQCGAPGEPCPGAYFRPGLNVTRGQAAKIISGTFFPNCQTPAKP